MRRAVTWHINVLYGGMTYEEGGNVAHQCTVRRMAYEEGGNVAHQCTVRRDDLWGRW
jgi:hypothetical protein